jgi:hypothetical protein
MRKRIGERITIRPKLSDQERRLLRRIAGMEQVTVVSGRITGSNEAYWEGCRTGIPRPEARMVALELDNAGHPMARIRRGGVEKLRARWITGGIYEVTYFRAAQLDRLPSHVKSKGPSARLKRAGVFPGAEVYVRRIGQGKKARAGIAIFPSGRRMIFPDHDGYTLLQRPAGK